MSEKTRDRGQEPGKREERDEASDPSSALKAEDDLALSALLDGELDPAEAEKLRAKLVAQPGLAERGAELGELSGHLQNLANPSERSEAATQLESERVDRMQTALRVRLAAEAAESQVEPEPVAPAPVISLGNFRREGWAAAAALAAGLLFYLAFGDGLGGGETSAPVPSPSEFAAAEPAVPLAESVPEPEPELESEASPGAVPEAREFPVEGLALESRLPAPVVTPGVAESDAEWAEINLAEAGQEELAIALEWEVLSDFDVIENLELLELLDGLDRMERI
jgi:hypothetical protein